MKQIYLPNQVCQLIADILSNLLFSCEDESCIETILEIYTMMFKVLGETKNVKFKTLLI